VNYSKKQHTLGIGLVAVAAASALVLSACAGSTSTTGNVAAKDQTLRIGMSADVPDLKPSRDQGGAAMILDTLIHRGLMGYDAKGKIVPALAESYKAIDDSTYEFVLRKGLTFQNGHGLTSGNVKKTLEYLARADSGAKIYATMSNLESVETPDDLTVIVHLKRPNVAFLAYLADTTAAILPDEAFTAEGTSWIGAGPYTLETNNKGVSFTLKKNKNFYSVDTGKLDKVVLTIYADAKARSNALLANDVDLIDFVPWEDFDRVKSTPGFVLDATSGPFMYVHFNVKRGPFAKELVRQAVALAVNRENVVSAAFSGHATPIAGAPIPTTSPFYDKTLANGWKTDVAKAKSLLAEAGYADGFTATLLTSSQYAFHQDTALSVQADLKAIGIKIKLDAPDWATRQEKAAAGQYDLAIAGSAGVVNDPSFLVNFVTGPAANNRSFGFDDSKLDALLAEALTTSNQGARKALYDQAQERILKTVPFVSLAGRDQAYAYSDRLTGFSNIPGFLTFEAGYTLASASLSQ